MNAGSPGPDVTSPEPSGFTSRDERITYDCKLIKNILSPQYYGSLKSKQGSNTIKIAGVQ